MHPRRSNHLSVTLGEKVNEFGGKIKEMQIITYVTLIYFGGFFASFKFTCFYRLLLGVHSTKHCLMLSSPISSPNKCMFSTRDNK